MKNQVSKKQMRNSCKGIAANNKRDAKNLTKERKTLRATIAHLAMSESEEAVRYRAFLNLKKNANQTQRNEVCNWVRNNYVHAAVKYVVTSDCDAVDVVNFGIVPTTANGNEITDFLKAIEAIKTEIETARQARTNVALQLIALRRVAIANNTYLTANKNGKRAIDVLIKQAEKAPRKNVLTTIHSDIIERK